jgi:Protein of unknown function, DUF417
MFLVTLTFILTTPGAWQQGYGFPFLSPMPGQFLLKDLVNLGAAITFQGKFTGAAGEGEGTRWILWHLPGGLHLLDHDPNWTAHRSSSELSTTW